MGKERCGECRRAKQKVSHSSHPIVDLLTDTFQCERISPLSCERCIARGYAECVEPPDWPRPLHPASSLPASDSLKQQASISENQQQDSRHSINQLQGHFSHTNNDSTWQREIRAPSQPESPYHTRSFHVPSTYLHTSGSDPYNHVVMDSWPPDLDPEVVDPILCYTADMGSQGATGASGMSTSMPYYGYGNSNQLSDTHFTDSQSDVDRGRYQQRESHPQLYRDARHKRDPRRGYPREY